ncbi:MAG: NADH-quinone oxidoreductase subunit L [Candidatus Margulisiibacteriota bacterium]
MVGLITLIPALSFVLIILTGFKLKDKAAIVSICALAASFILSLYLSIGVFRSGPIEINYAWFSLSSFALRIDLISAWMLLLVSGVALLIQIYSIGYMKGDPRFHRFFAYMSLFCSAMLGLVLANNLLLLYIFWELVGLCSYLLISFWFEKPSAAAAGRKAFIFTRAGDIGFFLGILLISFNLKTFDFNMIFSSANNLPSVTLTAITLLLFCGAVGKSAQFPLHVWLPDAMEGPTPVSALIHAATMVAAGVYMVARLFPLFALAPVTLMTIGYIGIITALLAGTIAVVQTDIKKVLAYSTISQLGFMMLAMGSRAPMAGMFHLISHGFFKALLFLGAGSIIHAVHSNEMNDMSGIRRAMPVTFITFMIGTLALSGIPPFSGFFSKDEVLLAAFHNMPAAFGLAVIAVFLTAFYMFRLCFKIFPGQAKEHGHESPLVMTIPLMILAVPAFGFGFFNPFRGAEAEAASRIVLISSLSAALLGIFCAWLLYGLKVVSLSSAKKTFLYRLVQNKYYMDEFYDRLAGAAVLSASKIFSLFDSYVIDGIVNLAGLAATAFASLNRLFDVYIVDGLVNLSGAATMFFSDRLRKIQTGFIQSYLLFIVAGISIILIIRR